MTRNSVITTAYFIGFCAVVSFTLPVLRYLKGAEVPVSVLVFLTLLVWGALSWSLARWITDRKHW